jgi:hypothetical protein
MTVKITLITPPDIFQNDNTSILLINLSEEEQNNATDWLSSFESNESLNIYFYQGEIDMPWFLHAMAVSNYKYINTDEMPDITQFLSGYVLGKPNTYYSTTNPNLSSLFGYINNGCVGNVTEFLERALSAKK